MHTKTRIHLALTAMAALLATAPATAEQYEIDGAHAFALFRVKHLGVGYSYGAFPEISGQFTFDPKAPEQCAVEVEIPVGSLDTWNDARDKHLLSADFFDVEKHPAMRFKSTAWKHVEGNQYEVTGDFTLLGETREVTAPVELVGTGEGMKGERRAGFEAVFEIDRTEFGMTKYAPDAVGAEVRIILSVEGVAKE